MTFGAQQNPLISWEEDFGQFRYVYLSPWNYLGLSSSQIGLTMQGPIKLYGGEATCIELDWRDCLDVRMRSLSNLIGGKSRIYAL